MRYLKYSSALTAADEDHVMQAKDPKENSKKTFKAGLLMASEEWWAVRLKLTK